MPIVEVWQGTGEPNEVPKEQTYIVKGEKNQGEK